MSKRAPKTPVSLRRRASHPSTPSSTTITKAVIAANQAAAGVASSAMRASNNAVSAARARVTRLADPNVRDGMCFRASTTITEAPRPKANITRSGKVAPRSSSRPTTQATPAIPTSDTTTLDATLLANAAVRSAPSVRTEVMAAGLVSNLEDPRSLYIVFGHARSEVRSRTHDAWIPQDTDTFSGRVSSDARSHCELAGTR